MFKDQYIDNNDPTIFIHPMLILAHITYKTQTKIGLQYFFTYTKIQLLYSLQQLSITVFTV